MNKKAKLGVYIFVIVLAVALVFIYIKYEKPLRQKPIEYTNLSLVAREEGNRIKTGFVVETSEKIIIGNTSRYFEVVNVPKNESIRVYNTNLDNQEYFKDIKELTITEDNFRVTLDLFTPEKISFRKINENPLVIEVYSLNARNLDFCIRHTVNYIYINVSNGTQFEKPENLTRYNSCYSTNISLEDSYENVTINYKLFGLEKSSDYFEVGILNGEFLDKEPIIVTLK